MKLEIDEDGSRKWRNEEGLLHHTFEPAIIWASGGMFWYRNGHCHRLDGHAFMCGDTPFWRWLGHECSQQHHTLLSNLRFFTKRVKI